MPLRLEVSRRSERFTPRLLREVWRFVTILACPTVVGHPRLTRFLSDRNSATAKTPMKYATIIVRVLLGLMFALFGSNAFLHFIPMPPMQGEAGAFIGALINSGYIYPIASLEVAGGLLLVIGRFVPLGLTLLGPVIVNIVLYHIFLDASGLLMAGVISILALFLLWAHRDRFPAIFHP